MLLKGTSPSKNVQLWQHFAMKLSSIFEFQLVPLAFSLILGDPFMVSLPIKYRGGGFFAKKGFSWRDKVWGANLWGDCSKWEDYQAGSDHTKGWGEFHKCTLQ